MKKLLYSSSILLTILFLNIVNTFAAPKITEFYLWNKTPIDTVGKTGVIDSQNAVDQFTYPASHEIINDSTIQILSVFYYTQPNVPTPYYQLYKNIYFNGNEISLINKDGIMREQTNLTFFDNLSPVIPTENDSVFKYSRYALRSLDSYGSGSDMFNYQGLNCFPIVSRVSGVGDNYKYYENGQTNANVYLDIRQSARSYPLFFNSTNDTLFTIIDCFSTYPEYSATPTIVAYWDKECKYLGKDTIFNCLQLLASTSSVYDSYNPTQKIKNESDYITHYYPSTAYRNDAGNYIVLGYADYGREIYKPGFSSSCHYQSIFNILCVDQNKNILWNVPDTVIADLVGFDCQITRMEHKGNHIYCFANGFKPTGIMADYDYLDGKDIKSALFIINDSTGQIEKYTVFRGVAQGHNSYSINEPADKNVLFKLLSDGSLIFGGSAFRGPFSFGDTNNICPYYIARFDSNLNMMWEFRSEDMAKYYIPKFQRSYFPIRLTNAVEIRDGLLVYGEKRPDDVICLYLNHEMFGSNDSLTWFGGDSVSVSGVIEMQMADNSTLQVNAERGSLDFVCTGSQTGASSAEVKVCDIMGNEIINTNMQLIDSQHETLRDNRLISGVYFISIDNGKMRISKKFMIK